MKAARIPAVLLALACTLGPGVLAQSNRPAGLEVRPEAVLYGYLFEGPLRQPSGLFFDAPHGELYVCDIAAHRVLIADERLFPVFAFGSETLLQSPRSVAVDPDGRIYVADSGRGAVAVFDYDGTELETLALPETGEGRPPRPAAVALAPDGALYVLDTTGRRVLRRPAAGGPFQEHFGRGGRDDLLRSAVGLALTPGGGFVVSDTSGLAVQVYDRGGRFLRGWGEHDIGVANFSLPAGLAVDGAGRIYVADTLRHDVKVFSPDGKFLTNFGGWGAGPGELRYPVGVATDGGSRVFVSERVGLRVQAFRVGEAGGAGKNPRRSAENSATSRSRSASVPGARAAGAGKSAE